MEARALRQRAWTFYSGVQNEDAVFSLVWREAQVADAVGDLADAGDLSDSARRKFIEKC